MDPMGDLSLRVEVFAGSGWKNGSASRFRGCPPRLLREGPPTGSSGEGGRGEGTSPHDALQLLRPRVDGFWGHFGVTLGSLWDHFGVTLGSLWVYEVGFGSLLGGSLLGGSLSGDFGHMPGGILSL